MLTVQPLSLETVDLFAGCVTALYAEDPGPVPMTRDRARSQALRMLGADDQVWPFLIHWNSVATGHLILASFWSNEFGGPMLFVDELYVSPSVRGQGVGRQVLQWAVAWARSHGFVRVELEVNRENARAHALYTRCGFEDEHRDLLGIQVVPLPT